MESASLIGFARPFVGKITTSNDLKFATANPQADWITKTQADFSRKGLVLTRDCLAGILMQGASLCQLGTTTEELIYKQTTFTEKTLRQNNPVTSIVAETTTAKQIKAFVVAPGTEASEFYMQYGKILDIIAANEIKIQETPSRVPPQVPQQTDHLSGGSVGRLIARFNEQSKQK